MQLVGSTERRFGKINDVGRNAKCRRHQCLFDGSDNLLCQLILKREKVISATVIVLGPKMATARINKLRRNTQPRSSLLNAPFQQIVHTKARGELGHVAARFRGRET
jgi:hypothetical protein